MEIYTIYHLAFYILIFTLLFELLLGFYRNFRRSNTYKKALQKSREVKKPLLVIGSPNAGFLGSIKSQYGCGDVCVDLVGCDKCEKSIKGDILDVLKNLPDNSHVIFESCVLEYIEKPKKKLILNEIKRVSNGLFFEVRINPTIIANILDYVPYFDSLVENGLK